MEMQVNSIEHSKPFKTSEYSFGHKVLWEDHLTDVIPCNRMGARKGAFILKFALLWIVFCHPEVYSPFPP